ncbi:MAG: hypothetical protein KatS3mg102_0748 [Planctomycetota bacterium]|nr:MAG: hypothetical protein KatS3mg102_0748 [Planctomycetota bacterium]
MKIHYLQFVCSDVDAQRAALAATLGLSFGGPVAELGNARVAEGRDGTRIGVRAPLAEHQSPVVRPYFAVDDIAAAVSKAEASGATIAYGPTQQGQTGAWAIFIMGALQIGLWRP